MKNNNSHEINIRYPTVKVGQSGDLRFKVTKNDSCFCECFLLLHKDSD